MGVLQQIWLYKIIAGVLLMCQNTTMRVYYGAWIKTYYVYVQKHIAALEMCHNQPLVRNICETGLFANVSVYSIYWNFMSTFTIFVMSLWSCQCLHPALVRMYVFQLPGAGDGSYCSGLFRCLFTRLCKIWMWFEWAICAKWKTGSLRNSNVNYSSNFIKVHT